MSNIFKKAGKRILAGALTAAMVVTSLPLQSTAESDGIMPAASGDTWYFAWGTGFSPSDGNAVGNDDYKYIENGSLAHHEASGENGGVISRLMLTDTKDGSSGTVVMCIECGADVTKNHVYKEHTTSNSSYWKNLSVAGNAENAKNLIGLTLYFGYNGKWNDTTKMANVSGSNNDDWALATQVLLWEIQQGIRNGTTGEAGSNDSINTGFLKYILGVDNVSDWLQQRLGGPSQREQRYTTIC